MTAPARRELVRHLVAKGLSERRSLAVVRMSASAYRYAPRPDRNVELRARILALAQRHITCWLAWRQYLRSAATPQWDPSCKCV